MVKTEQLAGLSTSLGIQSLRPPSIPRCIFRSQYYNLLHTLDLIARNQPKYCSDVPDDAGDDDTHDLDQDAGQSISSQTEVNHPLGQMNKRIPSVAESQHSKVPESSKPRTKTLLDLMKERQQAKLEQEASSKASFMAPSLLPNSIINPPFTTAVETYKPPQQERRVPLDLNRVYEVEICYTTGPDDFYIRTQEMRNDYNAISNRMNEYFRKDRRPASARMVAKREIVAMQSPFSQDWMRAQCVQMPTKNADDIVIEFVDSGEKQIIAQDETWLLHEMTGELFDVASAPSACIRCSLLDRNVTEDMWLAHLANQESPVVWMIARHISDGSEYEVELLEG